MESKWRACTKRWPAYNSGFRCHRPHLYSQTCRTGTEALLVEVEANGRFNATFHVGNCVLPSPFFPMLSMHLQQPTIVPKKYRAAWRRYIAGTKFCFKGLIYAMSSSCRILTSKTSWPTRVCLGFSSCKWRGQWEGTILLWTIYKIASPIWRCRWRSMAENRWNLSWCC